jgi:hypothetical protein
VRVDELPNIYNKFKTAQSELELSDDSDHLVDRQQFEDQYFEVKAKFNELWLTSHLPDTALHAAACQKMPHNRTLLA